MSEAFSIKFSSHSADASRRVDSSVFISEIPFYENTNHARHILRKNSLMLPVSQLPHLSSNLRGKVSSESVTTLLPLSFPIVLAVFSCLYPDRFRGNDFSTKIPVRESLSIASSAANCRHPAFRSYYPTRLRTSFLPSSKKNREDPSAGTCKSD